MLSQRIISLLIILMLAAALFSWLFFLPQSLRLDESQSLWQSSHSLSGILFTVGQDVHVPLYHFMLHGWQEIFGTEVIRVRLLSLFFFLLSIPAVYILARYIFSEATSLFTVLIFTLSPFMNWYGNELRMYSLLTLVTILSQYYFLRIFRARGRPGWPIWLGYLLSGLVGIYTHYFFLLSLFSQAIFFFVYHKNFKRSAFLRLFSIAIILALTLSPWLFYVWSLGGASNSRPLIPPPTLITFFNTFSNFLVGFQGDYLNSLVLSLWPLVMLLGFLALRRHQPIEPEVGFFWYSLFIPIMTTFALSFLIQPIFLSRYLILTLPSLYILIAWLFTRYEPSVGTVAKYSLIGLMMVMLFIETTNAQAPVKEDYQDAVSYLERHASAEDVIVVSAPFTIYPVEYYYRGPTKIMTLPIWDRSKVGPIPAFSESDLPNEIKQITDNYQNIWVLLSYDQGYEEKIRLYFDTHLERLVKINLSHDLTLYEYKLRYDQPAVTDAVRQLLTSLPASPSPERNLATRLPR